MGDEIKLFGCSSIVVVLLGLVGMVEYSLVMPVMEQYITKVQGYPDDIMYGYCMAVFSAARVLFMPVLGVWADSRPMIEPFTFSVVLSLLGNGMYALAEYGGSTWWIFFGRALVGMGAANSTLTMAYITRITTSENRTKSLAILNGINLLGIVLGPVTNIAINWTWPEEGGKGIISFNPLTNPGWVMFFLLVLISILMIFTFQEPPRYIHEDDELDVLLNSEDPTESLLMDDNASYIAGGNWKTVYWSLFWGESLWVHFVISFVSNFIVAELESALPVLTHTAYGWDTIANACMYSVIGIVTAIALILTGIYSKYISDRRFITWGTVLYGVALIMGCLVLKGETPPQFPFFSCCLLLIIAAPLTDSPNVAFYSKRLSEKKQALPYLSLFLGFLDASNGISRTIAPLYSGWVLQDQSDHFKVYIGPTVIWGLSAVVLAAKYKRFESDTNDPRTRFASVVSMDHSSGPFAQSPITVAMPNVIMHTPMSPIEIPS